MSFFKQGITLKNLLENPDLLNLSAPKPVTIEYDNLEKKLKDVEPSRPVFEGQSAFLGQNVWDKTISYDPSGEFKDYKLECIDLDEFLNENCIPSNEELNQLVGELSANTQSEVQSNTDNSNSSNDLSKNLLSDINMTPNLSQNFSLSSSTNSSLSSTSILAQHLTSDIKPTTNVHRKEDSQGNKSPKLDVDFSLNPQDLELARIPGQDDFDPRRRVFSDEELRPQPIIKKSRKIFVPDDSKDEKYWHRRKKNNVAAKRSREARRIKENQITLRAAYLEKENNTLKLELVKIKEENGKLKKKLSQYE